MKYPIILTPHRPGFLVYVPDFDIYTQGRNIKEALYMAADVIGLMGVDMQDEKKRLPVPSSAESIQLKKSEIITLVDVDFAVYRSKQSRPRVTVRPRAYA
jgi:predicted RNase H-like HicB family nuclease